MGYTSEVAIVLTQQSYHKGLIWMKENNIPDEENLLLETEKQMFKSTGNILMKFDHVKWYDFHGGFPEIKNFMRFLDTLDDEGEYSFTRVGEEYGDIVNDGWVDDNEVYVNTYIDIVDEKDLVKFDDNKMYVFVNVSAKDMLRYAMIMLEDKPYYEWRDKKISNEIKEIIMPRYRW